MTEITEELLNEIVEDAREGPSARKSGVSLSHYVFDQIIALARRGLASPPPAPQGECNHNDEHAENNPEDGDCALCHGTGKLTPTPPDNVAGLVTGPTGYHNQVAALLHRTGGSDGDGGETIVALRIADAIAQARREDELNAWDAPLTAEEQADEFVSRVLWNLVPELQLNARVEITAMLKAARARVIKTQRQEMQGRSVGVSGDSLVAATEKDGANPSSCSTPKAETLRAENERLREELDAERRARANLGGALGQIVGSSWETMK